MESNFKYKQLSVSEINELIEFSSKCKSISPERVSEIIVYGICASQLAEACSKYHNQEVGFSEAFEMANESLCKALPNSTMYDLRNYVQIALASMHMSDANRRGGKISEKKYHGKLIDFFDSAFPYLEFIGSEIRPHDDDRDRIDILAKCKESGRDAIIELKLGNKSAHKQLRSYAYGFEDPILINVSEDDVKTKREGIVYTTFKEIGINL